METTGSTRKESDRSWLFVLAVCLGGGFLIQLRAKIQPRAHAFQSDHSERVNYTKLTELQRIGADWSQRERRLFVPVLCVLPPVAQCWRWPFRAEPQTRKNFQNLL